MLFDDRLFDDLTEKAKASPRLRMHYDLRDSVDDGSMRMLNALEPGTVIPIHRHNDTSEEVICLRGVVEEIIYDSNGTEISRYRLGPSVGCLACKVPTGQFHTCVSLESGSVILEFKNGKYNPQTTEDFLPNPPSPHPATTADILYVSSASVFGISSVASSGSSTTTATRPITETNQPDSSDTSFRSSLSSSDASARTSSCASAHTSTSNSAQSVSATDSNQPDSSNLANPKVRDSKASDINGQAISDSTMCSEPCPSTGTNSTVSSTFIPAPDPRAFDGGDILRQHS